MLPLFSPQLSQLVNKINPQIPFRGKVLALDPGETTGFAVLEYDGVQVSLNAAGQLKSWPLEHSVWNITSLYQLYEPKFVVYEAYHVYRWKLEEHTFSRVPTIQIIGCLRTLNVQRNIKEKEQTAQVGKGFCTDDKLRSWGLYLDGLKHARDAIRHGCHFLLFHKD